MGAPHGQRRSDKGTSINGTHDYSVDTNVHSDAHLGDSKNRSILIICPLDSPQPRSQPLPATTPYPPGAPSQGHAPTLHSESGSSPPSSGSGVKRTSSPTRLEQTLSGCSHVMSKDIPTIAKRRNTAIALHAHTGRDAASKR